MKTTGKLLSMLALSSIALAGIGCRGDGITLGDVEGTVTLDGQPLPGVLVQFYPEAGGKPGRGETDADGKYKLKYDANRTGSIVGPNRVEITTMWPEGEPGEGETEKVPAKYNSKSTLKKEVIEGIQTIDLPLESDSGTTEPAE